MAKYLLTFGHQIMTIDSETLDPGELRNLKDLGHCAHFSLEREPKDKMPDMDHDVLDDIARELVAKHAGGEVGRQAKDRVIQRGLQ